MKVGCSEDSQPPRQANLSGSNRFGGPSVDRCRSDRWHVQPAGRYRKNPAPLRDATSPPSSNVTLAETSARRTLERVRRRAIEAHQPHHDLLRAAFPSPPEFDERAAVLAVLLDTLSPAEVVALFRLLYDESGPAVQRQVDLIADGATVDPSVDLAVRARLRSVGWPGR